jgi:hypothetical protein
VPDDTALARGVHALKEQQHAPPAAADALGVQRLLQPIELGADLIEFAACGGLGPRPYRGRPGIEILQVDRRSWQDPDDIGHTMAGLRQHTSHRRSAGPDRRLCRPLTLMA